MNTVAMSVRSRVQNGIIWFFALMVVGVFMFKARPADAEPTFHDSRVRLLLHGSYQLREDMGISGDFIPAGNLLGELAPLAYLMFDWMPSQYFTITPAAGWAFGIDEAIASIRLMPQSKDFYGWIDFEVQPQSWSFYWFVQAEWRATKWLDIGAEEESWGGFEEFSASTHGAGPNLIFHFGKVAQMDLALHIRGLDALTRPEFVLRFHLFFCDSVLEERKE